MSVKGRQFRQSQQPATYHGTRVAAITQHRRATGRRQSPAHTVSAVGWSQPRHAGALARESKDLEMVAEEGCARCGLERSAWHGSRGVGYAQDGATHCCQRCAEARDCPCG
jgi:hypothetical protein